MNSDSVTIWFRLLGQGDRIAAARLWERYGPALERLASARLNYGTNPVAGSDDLAQSVFFALWQGANQGKFPDVQDRHELWGLLLSIARNKAANRFRHYHAQKRHSSRGGNNQSMGRTTGESDDFDQMVDKTSEPPELLVMLQDEHDRLFELLPEEDLRTVASLKLRGETHEEIASQMGISKRTVIRKLELIRTFWASELDQ